MLFCSKHESSTGRRHHSCFAQFFHVAGNFNLGLCKAVRCCGLQAIQPITFQLHYIDPWKSLNKFLALSNLTSQVVIYVPIQKVNVETSKRVLNVCLWFHFIPNVLQVLHRRTLDKINCVSITDLSNSAWLLKNAIFHWMMKTILFEVNRPGCKLWGHF